ncbi:uncharacterized protein [Euphorbia lathyris]|uniref:uncharacterized protein isoform X2 n=1 Tax=Euphorbia lathyris TaxID=212925 RepID=UPI003313C194
MLNLEQKASYNIQPQVYNQGQPRPMPMSPNQSQVRESQACEQILSENIPSNVGFTGVQSSSSLTSAQPSVQQAQNFLPYLYQQLSDQNFIQPAIHQKKALMMQQLMAQLPNATNMQQNQLSGQQNQHTYLSSLQQTSVGPLQANITNFLSQSWENLLQQDIPLQSYPNMLQHENLKQLQEQMVHSQHLNQDEKLQQLTKQEMLQQQQFNQQAKQQLPALHNQHEMQQQFMEQQMLQQQQAHMVHSQQLNQHEIQQQQGLPAQMHQRDDVDEPDVFQQHISRGCLSTFV